MIEINLLPKELRKKKKKITIPEVKFAPVIAGAVALLVCIQVILSVTVAVKRNRLKTLEGKWNTIAPEAEEVFALNRKVNALNNKLKNIEGLRGTRLLWARKLNDLSDSIIPGIWFATLSVKEGEGGRYLSIEGYVSSFWKDEAAMIGRFMKNLKENKTFSRDFEDIRLDTMQEKRVKNAEVMSFSINCYFKGKG